MNDKKAFKYEWFVLGDLNGFFGLAFDNLTNLSFLAGILIFAFGFPADIVYKRMFPGTAIGVLFGDLVYTWMAFRLAKKKKSSHVTAMPLGLDAPSTIGVALAVLGPAFLAMKASGMDPHEAGMMTWYIGMATMIFIGIFKLIFSFFGSWVQKVVPQAGLLGSLAGIGLALIGFIPLVDVFGTPIVGMVALGLILYTLIAQIRLPKNFPGVLASIVVGTALYYALAPYGLAGGAPPPAEAIHPGLDFAARIGNFISHFTFTFPFPTLDFVKGLGPALKFLPIALPFGLLTVIGGINVTESARIAGDDYNTRDILLTEAIATLIAGVCGGVAQSTPYIGQPAYKQMGSRAGYTLLTGLFIGIGGILGYVSWFVEVIPRAVIAPILIFVALDIMCQAFLACPAKHAPAVAFSYFPTIARLLQIKMSNPSVVPMENFNKLMVEAGRALPDMLVTVALGNGFILTAMLWGAFIATLIDRKLKTASLYLWILAGFTFVGIVHSAIPDGSMYWPWTLPEPARQVPYQFAAGYAVLAIMMFALSYTKESREPAPAAHGH